MTTVPIKTNWASSQPPRIKAPTQEQLQRLIAALKQGRYAVSGEELRSHSVDWWPIAKKRAQIEELAQPGLVLWPKTTAEIIQIMRIAQEEQIPLTPYGGGSSVVGGAIPVPGGVVLDTREMAEELQLDKISQIVTVQTGLMGSDLEERLNARGYTLGHYPQSLFLSTVGGWVATRASGTFSSKYGNIEDLIKGLRIVLPGGELLAFDPVARASTGPDLKQLFLGSEGILGIVTEVDLAIQRLPAQRIFRGIGFDDLFVGMEAIRELTQSDLQPAAVRLYNPSEAERILSLVGEPKGQCLLILAWDGPQAVVEVQQQLSIELCRRYGGRDLGSRPGDAWYSSNRFDVRWLTEAINTPGMIADTIEMSMLWKDARNVYESVTEALGRTATDVLAHFSHVYSTGTSLYLIFTLKGDNDAEVEQQYFRAWADVMNAAIASGASISHHHGIGLMRARWMQQEHGDTLELLRNLKSMLDPTGMLNPGKLLPEK
ncbi:alkyldihydroxyacetonephosphate synthase [Ktedonobacteria bacterium brp13]|nr:alkyldihydroxyacetonephosphate synthase [Ktedonobacteria bacterium brp13]